MAKPLTGDTTNTAWSSTARLGEFRPYIPESTNVPEFTFKAVCSAPSSGSSSAR